MSTEAAAEAEASRLNDAYDLDDTAAWVRTNALRRVALQMPDELLRDAMAVAAALTRRCNAPSRGGGGGGGDAEDNAGVRVFVLADTTFGSCCVDEVAAAHHAADGIVHYGRACLSPVSRLPARFVFTKQPVDVRACAAAIRAHAATLAGGDVDAVVVLVDQEHAHAAAELRDRASSATTIRGGDGDGGDDGDATPPVPVVVADALPVEALPRSRARAARDGCEPATASSSRGECCGGGGCGGPSTAAAAAAATLVDSEGGRRDVHGDEKKDDDDDDDDDDGHGRVAGQRFRYPPGVTGMRACHTSGSEAASPPR